MSAAATPDPGETRSAAAPADEVAVSWELGGLALARGNVDRSTVRRSDAAWVAALWAEPATRVLALAGSRVLVRFSASAPGLVLVPPADAPPGTRFLLGVDDAGVAYFGVMAAALGEDAVAPGDGEVRPAGLREAGPLLDDRDAGLLTHAVALANWHESHPHCPRCGALTEPLPAGHARVCPADGSEHFPRTDPAVIMLVTDGQGRCLLARNQRWPAKRVSILAGFVEPGESAEQAVVREVAEETGVAVGDVRYLGSQPWPMPQSLMLGFRARAASGQQISVDAEEIAEARWFGREDLRAAIAAGDVLLPPPVSIAHRIIETWYGEPLPRGW